MGSPEYISFERMKELVGRLEEEIESYHINNDDASTLLIVLLSEIIMNAPAGLRERLISVYIKRLKDTVEHHIEEERKHNNNVN